MRVRLIAAALSMAVVSALAGCGAEPAPVENPTAMLDVAPQTRLGVADAERVLVEGFVGPDGNVSGVVPLIVLVPGGGWATADPSGLVPLAEHLGGLGAAVSLITYRAGEDNVYFPDQANDVACAVSQSVAAAHDAGLQVDEVTIIGHSAGAHLASLVALRPDVPATTCDYELVVADRLVGIAGPYDVTRAARFVGALFGPDNTDPADWTSANPLVYADERTELPVLLIHGQADTTVPTAFTEAFADTLRGAGHNLTVTFPEAADHHSIYSPDTAGPIIAEWLDL